MNEAVFKFKATGEVNIDSLVMDYGTDTPSEEWCHYPYVLKEEGSNDIYELRFPLSPFNVPDNGDSTRTCVVSGPIYVLPRLDVPVVNVDLTIKQVACLDKLNCSELLDNIEIYINSDEQLIGADGGLVEIERANYKPYFIENMVSVVDEHGNPCSWASFDRNGNVVVSRRYFNDYNEGIRTASVTYKYTYSYDSEIDNKNCSGEFTGEISQRPRECEDKDVELIEKNVIFPSTGCTRRLRDVISLAGRDSSAFEIRGRGDILVSGNAFGPNPSAAIGYSELCGYTITTVSNRDENVNLLEDKLGNLQITYHNKYVNGCSFIADTVISVNGISCEELLGRVSIAIKINDTGDFIRGGNIKINSRGTNFTVYILGDEYAEYFDINEDKCVIPTSVFVDGSTFTIPANNDQFLVKTFEFKFVAEILNDSYQDYSTYGCSFSNEFTFTQEVYDEIEEIGSKELDTQDSCESIERIPHLQLEYSQYCDEILPILSGNIDLEQDCE